MKINELKNSGNIAEIEVTYKNKVKPSERKKVTRSEEVYEILKSVWSDKLEYVEEFVLLCLNRAHSVLGWVKISQGGIAGTTTDVRVIYQIALNTNATSIIISHNHPSGNIIPSNSDIQITNKIKEGGKILDIALLDHLIITDDGFYSFANEGLI